MYKNKILDLESSQEVLDYIRDCNSQVQTCNCLSSQKKLDRCYSILVALGSLNELELFDKLPLDRNVFFYF